MNMKLTVAWLALGLFPIAAGAQEAPKTERSGYADVRGVLLDRTGDHKRVQEYDGKQYNRPWLDLGFSAYGPLGTKAPRAWFELDAKDLFSQEESASGEIGVGRLFKMDGDFDILTHRKSFMRYFIKLESNGGGAAPATYYRRNPLQLDRGALTADPMFKRQALDLRWRINLPEKTRTALFAEYFREYEYGGTEARWPSGQAAIANIDRLTQDYIAGAVVSPTETVGLAYEHIYRTFSDNSEAVYSGSPALAGSLVRVNASPVKLNADEFKIRWNPAKSVGAAGSLSYNSRENTKNGYIAKAYTGSLGATWTPSSAVGVTAKAFVRGLQIDENPLYRDFFGVQGVQQIDKNTFRGELSARWQALHALKLKGGYKLEYNHRRHAPFESFTAAVYDSGLVVAGGMHANKVAAQDTRHVGTLGAVVELPLDAELEGSYKKLIANRAVFESLPTHQDTAEGMLTVPLPGNVSFFAGTSYVREGNRESDMIRANRTVNTYLAGANWANSVVSFGIDGMHENSRTYGDQYFGLNTNPTGVVVITNLLHREGVPYLAKDNTAGANLRLKLPKGFATWGRGSYTWSKGSHPIHLHPLRTVAGQDTGTPTDLGPQEQRIVRAAGGVEYAWKDLTARASHRVDYFVDEIDPDYTGRTNITEVSLSCRF